jgi:hypothetical protein
VTDYEPRWTDVDQDLFFLTTGTKVKGSRVSSMAGRTSSLPMQATEGKRGESSGVTMPVTGTVMEATELKSDHPSSRKIGEVDPGNLKGPYWRIARLAGC